MCNEQNEGKEFSLITDALAKLFHFMTHEMIVRGIVFLLFGILMFCQAGPTIIAITVAVGILVLIDGVSMLIAAIKCPERYRVVSILGSVVLILFGFVSVFSPLMVNVVWIVIIGCWSVFNGVQCLLLISKSKKTAIFSGVLSIVAGVILISSPMLGLLTISWLIGSVAVISGITAVVVGLRLRGIYKKFQQ